MLKTVLPFCRELGIDKLLIECFDGNIGSEKTILANGGVYEYTMHEPDKNKDLKRFYLVMKIKLLGMTEQPLYVGEKIWQQLI